MDQLAVYWHPHASLLSEGRLSSEALRNRIFSVGLRGDVQHHHVLEPVSLTARLRQIKSTGVSTLPKITLDVILDSLPLRLTQAQFSTVCFWVDFPRIVLLPALFSL